MKNPIPLNYKDLRQKLNSHELDFKTTAELKPLNQFVGQERALSSVRFGVGIQSQGYNLYAMGPSGIGKRSLIRRFLEIDKNKRQTPSDWCYIHNFESPEKPIALELPPGTGFKLQRDMKLFIDEIATNILVVFESTEYLSQMKKINKLFNRKREKISKKLMNDKIPFVYKQQHKKEQDLQLRLTQSVVKPLIHQLKHKYKQFSEVVTYLNAVHNDIVTHVHDVIKQDEETSVLSFSLESPVLLKYQINLLVDNRLTKGGPVIFEENPTYSNTICRVEHTTQFGTLVTNFTLIRAGALHRANGGYLVLEARKLKKDPRAWEGLKRALYANEIMIDPVEHLSGSIKPISLEPMPIPLNVKVILLGDRGTYYYLCGHDPDFNELFKVTVDFDEQIERNKKNIDLYARLIATFTQRESLRAFNAAAVAEVIDHSSRIADDAEKMTTHIRMLNDLILEADYWAGFENRRIVSVKDVKTAITSQIYRMDRTRELYYEEIKRNFILINTKDKVIGQINALSVVKVGKFAFGHPTRITAKVRMGKGKIIDIQREIDMTGPIHTKAVLTLSHFLAARYNPDYLFSLSASVSFEQIYGMMEGDSASVAELCALLSALANVPLRQYLAVTGSIDQHGKVQAIGGVNEKIEGFFDVCKLRGLNGEQGVVIPLINVKNLMLREDVVEACKAKKFFVYTIQTVDDAISIFTGLPAGERDKEGKFPMKSINYRVEEKLREFSEHRGK
jgi:predicted ATP-dependent protease